MKKIRTIENICNAKGICFQTIILRRNYCSLSFHMKVECEYLEGQSREGLDYCISKRRHTFLEN